MIPALLLLALVDVSLASDKCPRETCDEAKAAAATPAEGAAAIAAARGLPRWFSTSGEARLITTLPPTELVVDNEGNTLGQSLVLDSRLRAGVGFDWKGFEARTEWDLFDGQLAGDAWDLRGTEDARHRESLDLFSRPDAFTARRLSVGGRVGPVALEGGLVTSRWGLGMLANDGAVDPEFGRNDFGDRVIRLRVATRPIHGKPLTIVVAGDRVVEDELADWSPLEGGEEAWQFVGSVIYGERDAARAGVYYVYRDQTEIDAVRTTRVHVADAYGDLPVDLKGADLRFAIEGAGIFGETSRGQSYTSRDGLAVQSAGVTGLAEARLEAVPLRIAARGGWASGDTNPDDGESNDFSFDRDFDVGSVLFDEVLGAVDAAAYAQLEDRANSGGAPDGAESLVAEGAFRSAAFVQPIVELTPKKWLSVKAGVLLAWSTRPIQQPFTTARNGGVPTNHLGDATDGYDLGTEINWSVKLGDVPMKRVWHLQPALLLQGGHLLAAENLGGETVTVVSAAARMRW